MNDVKESRWAFGPVTGCAYLGGFWLRVAGYGVSVVDRARHPPLFSERAGRSKSIRLGRWSAAYLPKEEKA